MHIKYYSKMTVELGEIMSGSTIRLEKGEHIYLVTDRYHEGGDRIVISLVSGNPQHYENTKLVVNVYPDHVKDGAIVFKDISR